MIRRPRLRTILIIVNVAILIVPVLGIASLRIYETELVRRTEAKSIAQAAFIKAEAERELREVLHAYGYDAPPDTLGHPGQVQWPRQAGEYLRPIEPTLSSSQGPILDQEERPVPPIGAADPLLTEVGERLEPTLIEAQRITLSGMSIVDADGNVVASTSSSHRGMALHHRVEFQDALEDGAVARVLRRRGGAPENWTLKSVSRETDVRVFVVLPLEFEGRIVGAVGVWRTPQSLPKTLYENRNVFILLTLLMVLAGLAMAALTSFYIGRPIQRLIAQTERVARDESDGTRPIDNPGTYEVQALSESIADMATALQERADYIQTFARSVSHEFKTPLTSIRGAAELLQDHIDDMSADERDEFLHNLDADARRLEHLVQRMLELARADLVSPTDETVDPVALASELANSLSRGDFEVLVDAPDSLCLAITEDALRDALTNLVVNARQHGGDRALIEITVDPDLGQATICVTDDGPGISEGNLKKIFDDFFTTARTDGGTGLGLSITRALVEAHGGTIEHVPTDTGARFCLTLPVADAK